MLLGQPTEGIQDPPGESWIVPIAVLIPIVAVCLVRGTRLPHGTERSLTLAVAAGLVLGYSAPFTKTGMDAFGHGFLSGVMSWEFWAMAITATLGTLWQQSSYQAGDVQTSLPTVTVLKPVVAMMLGLTIYQEHLKVGHVGDALVIAALVVMFIAAFALGRLGTPPDSPEAAAAGGPAGPPPTGPGPGPATGPESPGR